jgi:hypothetical protein
MKTEWTLEEKIDDYLATDCWVSFLEWEIGWLEIHFNLVAKKVPRPSHDLNRLLGAWKIIEANEVEALISPSSYAREYIKRYLNRVEKEII